ncbi:DinB family protein [Brevibacillus choshinensis]|uniref:DinB family protein n=1 Tax=Brevibacillus choshinensis TaxID=54911 RepID=UPI002E20FC05|nr:DinB family protein [Brevibacillus choshinensis]MED4751703.1 DinB family protein [Brevibacillus choshinensis]MED4780058.1 DinB family protein [Brevibacillus choshinensis]
MHLFYKQTLNLLDTELDRIKKALDRLPEELVWKKGRDSTNSIGNLCLHLAGNEYQNVVSAIGGKPFVRERSAEFLAVGTYTSEELQNHLFRVREQSREEIERLSEEDFHREVTIVYPPGAGIASYQKTILEILFHTTSHYSYHTGQIVYMTRLLQDGDERLLRWKH